MAKFITSEDIAALRSEFDDYCQTIRGSSVTLLMEKAFVPVANFKTTMYRVLEKRLAEIGQKRIDDRAAIALRIDRQRAAYLANVFVIGRAFSYFDANFNHHKSLALYVDGRRGINIEYMDMRQTPPVKIAHQFETPSIIDLDVKSFSPYVNNMGRLVDHKKALFKPVTGKSLAELAALSLARSWSNMTLTSRENVLRALAQVHTSLDKNLVHSKLIKKSRAKKRGAEDMDAESGDEEDATPPPPPAAKKARILIEISEDDDVKKEKQDDDADDAMDIGL